METQQKNVSGSDTKKPITSNLVRGGVLPKQTIQCGLHGSDETHSRQIFSAGNY